MIRLFSSWLALGSVFVVGSLAVALQQPPELPATPEPPESIQPTWDPPPAPPEAYPGQSTHAQPPEGWDCMRQNSALSVAPEHACTCERMFDPDDPTVIREDRECTVWCHADHCKCGIHGKAPGHQ